MTNDQKIQPVEPTWTRACKAHPVMKLEPEPEYAVDPQEIAACPVLTRATKAYPVIVLEPENEFAVQPQNEQADSTKPPVTPQHTQMPTSATQKPPVNP